MTTTTLTPIQTAPQFGVDSNIILVQIAVPETMTLLFPVCCPRGNYLAAGLLREAIIAKLSVNPENIRIGGELNKLMVLMVCDSTPSASAMNTIRDLLAQNMALDLFAVISRHCSHEGFFREYWRGSLAYEVEGMATFETLLVEASAASAIRERLASEIKAMVTLLREYAASLAAKQPPPQA